MIDVQPTSCMTFSTAKSSPPRAPNAIFTVSIALRRVRAPMSPARKSRKQPITCPAMMAVPPSRNPSGAKNVPVKISASDTPAPNQISAFAGMLVLFSMTDSFII